jgi:hypothetical protein
MSRALATKRIVLGQVTICTGCCCGAVGRGHPNVPVDWLKQEWRARGLLKRIQLTISGCVGPCDVPNVVVIASASGTEWLGGITEFSQYQALVAWASRSKEKGALLPLPAEFQRHTLDPFRGQTSSG